MSATTTCIKRLKAVIQSLERQQDLNYNPVTSLILSYLIDIRDGKVPNYVIKTYEEILAMGKQTK